MKDSGSARHERVQPGNLVEGSAGSLDGLSTGTRRRTMRVRKIQRGSTCRSTAERRSRYSVYWFRSWDARRRPSRGNDGRGLPRGMTDRRHVEVIGTIARNEDKVSLRQSFVVALACRIYVDHTAHALNDQRSKVDQRNVDRSGIGTEISPRSAAPAAMMAAKGMRASRTAFHYTPGCL